MADGPELAIDLGDTATHQCPCCGRESTTVHGYLYDETGETSVYFAGYAHGHPERRANMVVSIGGWGEGMMPADRKSIALQVVFDGRSKKFVFPAAETSPWYGEEFLGQMKEATQLSEGDRLRFCELARVATEKDPRVAWYLEHG